MSRHKRILVLEAKDELNAMKQDIQNHVQSGHLADVNGSIGGEMTKRLVAMGEKQLMKQKEKGI